MIPFELKGVKCIKNDGMETELSARDGVVGPTEVLEQLVQDLYVSSYAFYLGQVISTVLG